MAIISGVGSGFFNWVGVKVKKSVKCKLSVQITILLFIKLFFLSFLPIFIYKCTHTGS